MRMKIGSVLSQSRVEADRPGLISGRARFGMRDRRGPDVSPGGGIKGSLEFVSVGFAVVDCVEA